MTKKRKKKIMDRKFEKFLDRWFMKRMNIHGLSDEQMRSMGFVKTDKPLVWYPVIK